MRIGSSSDNLFVSRNLGSISRAMGRALERLSTGRRVNSPRDDASAAAQEVGLQSQIRGLRQVARNINDGLSTLQIADSVLGSQTELVQRMRELAVQASSGILSVTDRQNLQLELDSLLEEFDRLAESATFNGSSLLDGSFEDIGLQVTTSQDTQTDLSLEDSRGGNTFQETLTYGNGNFTLISSSDSPISNPATVVTDYDFNNDGLMDLYTRTNANPTTVSIQISNGDGTFTSTATLAMGASQTVANPIDLNNDGVLDIYATNSTGDLRVYYGTSNGEFGAAVDLATNITNWSLPEDSNGDGLLDFIGYRGAAGTVAPIFQKADGTFAPPSTYSSVGTGMFTTTADLNNDGRSDVITRTTAGNQDVLGVYLHQSDGSFNLSSTFTIAANFSGANISTHILDLDNDGDIDIASYGSSGQTTILYNNGSGGFGTRQTLAQSLGLTPVDFNGDGRLELSTVGSGAMTIYLIGGLGTYSSSSVVNFASASYGIGAIADMNNDGDIDIVAYNTTGGIANIYSNNGTGTFSLTASTGVSLATHTISTPVDMNGDGLLDLSARRTSTDSYWFSYQQRDGSFASQGILNTGVTNRNLATIDANNDGSLDLVFAGTTSPAFAIYLQEEETTYEYLQPNVETATDAQNSLAVLDRALENLNSRRSQVGSLMSRLESTAQTTSITGENLESARSNLVDADIAVETADLVRLQILQQVQISVAAQANLQRRLILELLR